MSSKQILQLPVQYALDPGTDYAVEIQLATGGGGSSKALYRTVLYDATLAYIVGQSNTWADTQTFAVAPVFTDGPGTRTALGLGSAATTSSAAYATAAQGTKADTAVQPGDLAVVATTGAYNDLSGRPTIPAAQVNSDWIASSGVTEILNKPTLGTVAALDVDTDGALTANSDSRIPTQKAVRTFVSDSVTGLLELKGATDCSTNPNYPAALKGDTYVVSVAGRIGGAAGIIVSAGDTYIAIADNAGGNQATVGAFWVTLERTLVGVMLSANDLSDVASVATARANLGVPAGSGTSTGVNTGDQTTITGNAGSATVLATPRTIDGTAFDGSTDITVIAAGVHAAIQKASIVDTDEFGIADSAVSYLLKKILWGDIKAASKAYTDTLYLGIAATAAAATKLATARNINGVPFDGTADVNVVDPTAAYIYTQLYRGL